MTLQHHSHLVNDNLSCKRQYIMPAHNFFWISAERVVTFILQCVGLQIKQMDMLVIKFITD